MKIFEGFSKVSLTLTEALFLNGEGSFAWRYRINQQGNATLIKTFSKPEESS